MSGFVKASAAAGWSREDATVRVQKRGVQSLKEEPLDRGQRTDSMGALQGLDQPGLGDGSTWSWPSGGTAVSSASWGQWEEIWVGWAPTQRCPLGNPER